MNVVGYLKEIYGSGTPILLKDIRIGRKSKTAIRAELSRAAKKGLICRETDGVYFFPKENSFFTGILFEDIVKKRYIKGKNVRPEFEDLDIYGYYSGITFLNRMGLTEQFPMALEITTNCTSSRKREVNILGQRVILRKGRIEINPQNAKSLQFLDMFRFLDEWEVKENKDKINRYVRETGIGKDVRKYLPLYGFETIKKITEGGIVLS